MKNEPLLQRGRITLTSVHRSLGFNKFRVVTMDPNVIAYILLGATMVVPGVIILAIVCYTNARRQARPRRRMTVGKRAIPRPL
jgi:hypothetical protein